MATIMQGTKLKTKWLQENVEQSETREKGNPTWVPFLFWAY